MALQKLTFNDEDPGPSGMAADTSHLDDAAGKQTTKGTGSGSGREEDSHSKTALVTSVPLGDARSNMGQDALHCDSRQPGWRVATY